MAQTHDQEADHAQREMAQTHDQEADHAHRHREVVRPSQLEVVRP